MFVFIVFKAESEPKHKEKICWWVVLQKPKTHFLGGKNKVINSNLKFVFLHLFFIVKGSFMPIFTKKITIWAPGVIWKWKL